MIEFRAGKNLHWTSATDRTNESKWAEISVTWDVLSYCSSGIKIPCSLAYKQRRASQLVKGILNVQSNTMQSDSTTSVYFGGRKDGRVDCLSSLLDRLSNASHTSQVQTDTQTL